MSPIKALSLLCLSSTLVSLQAEPLPPLAPETHLVALGSSNGLEMVTNGSLELQIQQRFPKARITFRHLCREGLSFEDLEKRDAELSKLSADTILLFSGYREAIDPESTPDTYKASLSAYLKHLKEQKYNGKSTPRIIVVNAMAFDERGSRLTPERSKQLAERLDQYAALTREIAKDQAVEFIDFFKASKDAYANLDEAFTHEGLRLQPKGQSIMATRLILDAFGPGSEAISWSVNELNTRLNEKTALWSRYGSALQAQGNEGKALNWLRSQTSILDPLIWSALTRDQRIKPDNQTVVTQPEGFGSELKKAPYLYSEETLKGFKLREGFKIQVFADEEDFPDLAKPVEMTFDSDGSLMVSTQPSAPAYSTRDVLPNDKIIALKDTDGDSKADSQKLFLGGLDRPSGPILSNVKVFLTQGDTLISNPSKPSVDKHAGPTPLVSGLTGSDAAGALHEDATGNILIPREAGIPVSSDNGYGTRELPEGGVFRYDLNSYRLEVEISKNLGNPRTSFMDRWGRQFFTDATNGKTWSALSLSASHSGAATPAGEGILPATAETAYAAAIVDSSHFPENLQGKLLLSGRQRIRLISLPDGSGNAKDEGDLLTSADPNFFPTDLKFGPDGALYILDRQDPGSPDKPNPSYSLDHKHGRIYRITANDRELKMPKIFSDLNEAELLTLIQKGDGIDRSFAKRELRSRDAKVVGLAVNTWLATLTTPVAENDRCWLEALYLSVGRGSLDPDLASRCLNSQDARVKSAALTVIARPEWAGKYPLDWLKKAAADSDKTVRLAVLVACSRMADENSAAIFAEAMKQPLGPQEETAVQDAFSVLKPHLQKLRADGKLDLSQTPALSKLLQ
jgi:hypothetical protein